MSGIDVETVMYWWDVRRLTDLTLQIQHYILILVCLNSFIS